MINATAVTPLLSISAASLQRQPRRCHCPIIAQTSGYLSFAKPNFLANVVAGNSAEDISSR